MGRNKGERREEKFRCLAFFLKSENREVLVKALILLIEEEERRKKKKERNPENLGLEWKLKIWKAKPCHKYPFTKKQ